MVLDVYSRKIVGHEVHVAESADLAALLMRKASLAEGLAGRKVVLLHRGRAKRPATRVVTSRCATEPNRLWHSDNGSAMKGATMLAALE